MNYKIFIPLFFLFISFSCTFYDHSNPYDPDYSGSLPTAADLKISSIQFYDACQGIDICPYYGIIIVIENKGKRPVAPPIQGTLSSMDSRINVSETGNKNTFPALTSQDQFYLNPRDKVQSSFLIDDNHNIPLPFQAKFKLTLKDGNNNSWEDTVIVVINN